MTLRWKTILVIGVTFAALLGILFAFWQTILVRRFTELERQDTSQNTERAVNAVQQDIDSVGTAAADWGIWDDTYFFAQDGNQDYIDANFQNSSFTSLQMNLILVIDSSGQVLHGEAFDLQNQVEVPIPTSLEAHISGDSPLMQHPDEEGVSGIAVLPEGLMLVASQPILDSQGEGPVQGTLIMGRFFDSAEIERLAALTNLSLAYYSPTIPACPPISK
jgi:sensor domain CHASE-containing protein